MSGTTNTQLKDEMSSVKDDITKIMHYLERIDMKQTAIESCLVGTKYDAESNNGGGGIVGRVTRLERQAKGFNKFMIQAKTGGAIISTVISGLWVLVVTQWDKLVK